MSEARLSASAEGWGVVAVFAAGLIFGLFLVWRFL